MPRDIQRNMQFGLIQEAKINMDNENMYIAQVQEQCRLAHPNATHCSDIRRPHPINIPRHHHAHHHYQNTVQYWEPDPIANDPFANEDPFATEEEDALSSIPYPYLTVIHHKPIEEPITPPRPYRSTRRYNGLPGPRSSSPPPIPPRKVQQRVPYPTPRPNMQCAFCSEPNIVYMFDCQHTICRDCGAGEKCPLCSVSYISPVAPITPLTPLTPVSSSSASPIKEVPCPLCLEIPHPSDVAILTCDCTTLYCPPCITKALQHDNRCPTCRKPGVQFVRMDTLELN